MVSLFDEGEVVLDYPPIYGISTSLRSYRLAFLLAQHRDLDVECREDLSDYGLKSTFVNYGIYSLEEEREYLLIKNKGEKGWFYPRFKNVDYLLCSLTEEDISKEFRQQVAATRGISICFVLDKPNQKDILNFTQLL